MIRKCTEIGINPFVINVISFHGHGFKFKGDPIAVLYEETKDEQFEARFVNMGGVARKFANLDYTINIFLMSMCRVDLEENIHSIVYDKQNSEENDNGV